MARCSICHTLVQAGEEVAACDSCGQEYHAGCWDELGGCATYGCQDAAQAEKPEAPVVVSGGWGDEKECPVCRHALPSSYLHCRCGARFPWADPMTREEYAEWQESARKVKVARNVLISLFFVSLFGFVAPLSGGVAGVYAWSKRNQLAGPHGTYLALGYASAALGFFYAVTMLLLAAGM